MSHSRGDYTKTFDLGKFIIVRLDRGKNRFEMIADPDAAWEAKIKIQDYRKKEKKDQEVTVEDLLSLSEVDLSDIFQTYDIFNNVKKGDQPTEEEIQEAFNTNEPRTLAAIFVLEGDFAWTQNQRKEWTEKKKKQIINILARNCINPQTKKPHPPARIDKAMEEAKVSIDMHQSAEEQVEAILKKLQVIIPIRMETLQMAVKVPAVYAAKAYNTVDKYSQIKNSEWQTDGSWIGLVSLPAGLQMEFIDKLNKLTHGRVQTKLIQN